MKLVKESLIESLSPSGALYGFAGWLTTRDEPIIMSSHHDAAIVAELLDEFIKKQKLEEPKEHWEDDLISMKESLNESMAYKDFFGKQISHEEALHKSIRDDILDIVCEVNYISEKDFKKIDLIIKKVKEICEVNPEIYEKAEEFYSKGKRLELLAEEMYEKYFKNIF